MSWRGPGNPWEYDEIRRFWHCGTDDDGCCAWRDRKGTVRVNIVIGKSVHEMIGPFEGWIEAMRAGEAEWELFQTKK